MLGCCQHVKVESIDREGRCTSQAEGVWRLLVTERSGQMQALEIGLVLQEVLVFCFLFFFLLPLSLSILCFLLQVTLYPS